MAYCNKYILLFLIKEQLKAVQRLEQEVAGYKPQMDELELVHQVRKGALCCFLFVQIVFAYFIELFLFCDCSLF